jgi:RNA polymerase sigma-70 factor (ECF subfamily)
MNESTFESLECERASETKMTSSPPVADASEASERSTAPLWHLIEAEIPFLKRRARRWHRQGADADDLVQDTLLRALASAHLWEPGSNLRAWLLTIMRNQFLTEVAKSQRAKLDGEIIELADTHATENAELRLTLRDVERAARRLPQKQRAAMQMAGIEGRSYREIASVMNVSVDAVRCHLARARNALRTAVYRRDEPTWISAPTQRPGGS